jgi:putative transposase
MVGRFPRLKKVLADGIYNGGIAEWAKEVGGWILEVVAHPKSGADDKAADPEGPKKFKVLKWRWIVERTFAWLGRYRRLSKDYEGSEASSECWIYLAMTHLMLRRLDPA